MEEVWREVRRLFSWCPEKNYEITAEVITVTLDICNWMSSGRSTWRCRATSIAWMSEVSRRSSVNRHLLVIADVLKRNTLHSKKIEC